MHQLLIVDRQKSNHQKIRQYLDESGLKYNVIAEVTSAEDAERILLQKTVDLIIADDVLPVKSGLQLFNDNKENYQKIHMILFTDYNRFNNTKDLLTGGRIDTLFKPIRKNDVIKSLMHMDHIIGESTRKSLEQTQLRAAYENQLDVFKDRFLINLVHGHLDDDTQILEQLSYFNIPHGETYVACVLKIDAYRKYQLALDEDEKQFLIFKALSAITGYLEANEIGIAFINRYDEISFILTNELSRESLFDHCFELQEILLTTLSLRGTIGVGNTYSSPTFISVSYTQARAALAHNFYLGAGSVIHIDYVAKNTDLAYYYPRSQEQVMVEAVVNGDEKAALGVLHKLVQALSLVNTLPEHYYALLVIDILVNINRTASENNVSIESFFKDYIRLNEINDISSSVMAYDYLKDALSNIAKYQTKHRDAHKLILLDEIFNYVSTYYANKISLRHAAEYLKTTPQYLESLIFTKYDKSFYDYCIFVRLSKAKEFLGTTNYSTTEIATKIGFNNTEYFTAIFKQHLHITPAQYRHDSKHNYEPPILP